MMMVVPPTCAELTQTNNDESSSSSSSKSRNGRGRGGGGGGGKGSKQEVCDAPVTVACEGTVSYIFS